MLEKFCFIHSKVGTWIWIHAVSARVRARVLARRTRRHAVPRHPSPPTRLPDCRAPKANTIIGSPRPEPRGNVFPLALSLARAPGWTPHRASRRRALSALAVAHHALILSPFLRDNARTPLGHARTYKMAAQTSPRVHTAPPPAIAAAAVKSPIRPSPPPTELLHTSPRT
jgi:hypothetical protein